MIFVWYNKFAICGCGEMADALSSGGSVLVTCGFESHQPHHIESIGLIQLCQAFFHAERVFSPYIQISLCLVRV